jgi:hypothetical protein
MNITLKKTGVKGKKKPESTAGFRGGTSKGKGTHRQIPLISHLITKRASGREVD